MDALGKAVPWHAAMGVCGVPTTKLGFLSRVLSKTYNYLNILLFAGVRLRGRSLGASLGLLASGGPLDRKQEGTIRC